MKINSEGYTYQPLPCVNQHNGNIGFEFNQNLLGSVVSIKNSPEEMHQEHSMQEVINQGGALFKLTQTINNTDQQLRILKGKKGLICGGLILSSAVGGFLYQKLTGGNHNAPRNTSMTENNTYPSNAHSPYIVSLHTQPNEKIESQPLTQADKKGNIGLISNESQIVTLPTGQALLSPEHQNVVNKLKVQYTPSNYSYTEIDDFYLGGGKLYQVRNIHSSIETIPNYLVIEINNEIVPIRRNTILNCYYLYDIRAPSKENTDFEVTNYFGNWMFESDAPKNISPSLRTNIERGDIGYLNLYPDHFKKMSNEGLFIDKNDMGYIKYGKKYIATTNERNNTYHVTRTDGRKLSLYFYDGRFNTSPKESKINTSAEVTSTTARPHLVHTTSSGGSVGVGTGLAIAGTGLAITGTGLAIAGILPLPNWTFGLTNTELVRRITTIINWSVENEQELNNMLQVAQQHLQNILSRPGPSHPSLQSQMEIENARRRIDNITDIINTAQVDIQAIKNARNKFNETTERNALQTEYANISSSHNNLLTLLKRANAWEYGEPTFSHQVPTDTSKMFTSIDISSALTESEINKINEVLDKYLGDIESPIIEQLNYPEAIQAIVETQTPIANPREAILQNIRNSPLRDNDYTQFGSPQLNELIHLNRESIIPYSIEDNVRGAGLFRDYNNKQWFGLYNGKLRVIKETRNFKFLQVGGNTIRIREFNGKFCVSEQRNLPWLRDNMLERNLQNVHVRDVQDFNNFAFHDQNESPVFVPPARENIIPPTPYFSNGLIEAIRNNNIRLFNGNDINGELTLVNNAGRVRDAENEHYLTVFDNSYVRVLRDGATSTRIGDNDNYLTVSNVGGKYNIIPKN